ncbi:LysM peptidoglycan-binding domain-containing protein [Halalkalibacter krulwichiae]|uniref:D-gamma-glutamyl-meso-diaminopimelic acid endopeptidase CwlS n=1 Tax=Halalkalibacter krulwichiae TaxID=199441 RepID=A0A1X9M9P6_9BACI|nr:LysM peptidoglycan-binding domain-containing protein [Halalkalibacter krulwichiae]ARK30179.1 D-gamma-glutamyl-meso-diaminopimelic acid endopeptidase CwlS precursor [Halalkalibacter krulwichiae]
MKNGKKYGVKFIALSLGLSAMLGFAPLADAGTYEVKKGDTLYRIALNYKMSVDELKMLNGLSSNTIFPGQQLKVTDAIMTYHVQKGDTLYRISQNYQMTVADLKALNHLTSDIIFPGQELKVVVNKTIYEVQKGDTLYRISNQHDMTVEQLKQINHLKTNLIFPGQKLLVKGPTLVDPAGINIRVQSGFQFVKEEPRTYQLFSTRDNGFFARVEMINQQATVADLKAHAKQYLQTIGTVHEMKDIPYVHPFYKQNVFYMESLNHEVKVGILIKEIDGKLVRIILHLPDKEESEFYTPALLDQLQTLTFKK